MNENILAVDAERTPEEVQYSLGFSEGISVGIESVTFADKLIQLKDSVVPTWTSRNEAAILTLRSRIDAANKVVAEIRQAFDVMCDNVTSGAFGEDFVTEVTRLRKANHGAGRPATKPKPISALNF